MTLYKLWRCTDIEATFYKRHVSAGENLKSLEILNNMKLLKIYNKTTFLIDICIIYNYFYYGKKMKIMDFFNQVIFIKFMMQRKLRKRFDIGKTPCKKKKNKK